MNLQCGLLEPSTRRIYLTNEEKIAFILILELSDMKNLLLQMTDTSSLTKPLDANNKNNASVLSSMTSDNYASFQVMLNRQVQENNVSTQDAQYKQDQAHKNTAKNTVEKESSSITTKSDTSDITPAQKNAQKSVKLQAVTTSKNHTEIIKDTDNANSVISANKDLIEPDAKTDIDTKKVEDNKPDDISISATLLPSVTLENKQLALSLPNENTKLRSTSENLSEKQRSLVADINDTVLNNALSKVKSSNSSELQDAAVGDEKYSQSNWVEKMLPTGPGRQINGDETTKLTLTAIKEGISKEFSNKELTISDLVMPANFQSPTQIQATEAMQQIGSSNTINAYPGKTGWDQAISQKVVWMLGAQEQSATLTLNPPELGPLQVVIHVHNDQADTTFTSDNPEVRQALQDGMANLRDKMSESGIQLGQANVNSGGQMQQQFQQASQQNGFGLKQNSSITASQPEIKSSSQHILRVSNGIVDTFA